MKKFNKDKYLKKLKLKRFWQNNSRYFYIGVPCILCGILGIYFAYSKFFVSQGQEVVRATVAPFIRGDVVINNYINGQLVDDVPAKATGYKVDKIVCDNGAVGEWNGIDWGPTISNVTRRSKCNIYFVPNDKINIGNVELTLDEFNECPSLNEDGSINVTKVEYSKGYICKAKDTYGDSYYYRGNVTNNYVKFGKWSKNTPDVVIGFSSATSTYFKEYSTVKECQSARSYNVNCTVISKANKDMYWRIIRINGDGTVRVIYDGTSAHANGEKSVDRQIGTSAFNSSSNDNAYVGYMYGSANASTYQATHANTNNSTIKAYLDTWYGNNIKSTINEQYIVDNIFCNDRSFSPKNTGTGFSASDTYYRGNDSIDNFYNKGLLLTCPQQNDAFTLNDTINGNGALTYGIGLITLDEAAMAGGWTSYNNNKFYLYTGQDFWTMTPNGRYTYALSLAIIELSAYTSTVNGYIFSRTINSNNGVRPVLNLKSDILLKGTGTADDPYRLS